MRSPSSGPIRVLLVEDSPTARAFVISLIGEQPDMCLVGSADNGLDGVAMARALQPDVVLMDANIPGLDGFQATRRIMEEHPTRIVMITASLDVDDVRTSMRSLEAGALAVICKPHGPDHARHEASVRQFVDTIRLMSEVTVVRRRPAREAPPPERNPPRASSDRRRLVVIGTSTGGPRVLARILGSLPQDFSAPICIVQHISAGFLPGLVAWLSDEVRLAVSIAVDGGQPAAGNVYFAPDGRHLGFAGGGAMQLSSCGDGSGFCPSVSHLFHSAAAVWGRAAVGVLLTGMGRDGVEGLMALRAAGGVTIAQSPASCAVDGMPAAAIALGAAMMVLEPESIAAELCDLVMRGRGRMFERDRIGSLRSDMHLPEMVLIAEDSPTQSEHLAWLLDQAGYKVAAAADGKRALAMARELRPAIVVSDVVMPGMDGYELCRAIKNDPDIKSTPVVLVTELSRPQDVFKGLNCGADNFVTKPYDERYLVTRLRYLSANKSLRSTGRLQVGVEIELHGERHFITAERQQILDLLISTYDEAVHLNDELRDRQRELEAFLESLNGLANVTEALNRSATVEQVLREGLGRTMGLLAGDAGWIRLRDPERPDTPPWLAARDGIDETDLPPDADGGSGGEGAPSPAGYGVRWEILTASVGKSGAIPRLRVTVPILIEERDLGTLNVWAPAELEMESRHVVMLTAIGQQIGIALDRARLHTNLEQTVALRTAELRQEVAERRRAEERAQARSRQLAEVVRLGNLALADAGLAHLYGEVVASITATLGVPFGKIFEYRPDSHALVRVAGAGWPEGSLGSLVDCDDPTSLAAHALRENAPGVVVDWQRDPRFRMPDAFLDLGIRSSVAVPIVGTGRLYGVLGADARAVRTFGDDEVGFLVSVANIISAAIARAEGVEALRRSEDEFRATFEQAPIGIAHVELDGRWRRVNRRLCRILDCSKEEILARSFADLTHPDDREASASAMGRIQRGEADRSVQEKRYIRKGGREVWTRVTTTVKRRQDHSPEYVIGIIEDISEQREAQAQIAHLQRMEAMGRLTSGIAHDFNNLLTLIIGNLELLEGLGEPDDPSAVLVKGALEGATRGAELTGRLLALARRQPLHPQVVDVNQLVGGMADLLQRAVGQDVEVVLHRTPERCLSVVDAAQLESALMNLAVNARDAMPNGGSLVVGTSIHEFSEIDARQFDGLEPGDYVGISVSDSGTGIPPDVVERIFEPYYTTKEMGKGTGLGLSIVYGFVKQSGGHIVVYTEMARGTTFRLYLPCHAVDGDSPPGAGALPPVLPAARPGERVLLVDDRAEVRQALAGRLRDLGYEVVEALNGREALDWLDEGEDVGLVLTDVVMSGQPDGLGLAQQILQKRDRLPVIVCSGLDAHSFQEAVRDPQRCAVVGKPYALAEMARTIRRLLDAQEVS